MHIAHRLPIFRLTVVKFLLQLYNLVVELTDISVKHVDVATDSVDSLSLIGNLRVNDHQVLQPLLHVAFVVTQFLLLRSNLLLYLFALVLQPLYRRSGNFLLTLFLLRRCLLFLGGLRGLCLFCSGGLSCLCLRCYR